MLRLDHIAVAGETRQAATDYIQDCLKVAPLAAGQHFHFSTHNHLWGMGEACYLESIAVDPQAPSLAYPRWFGLDRFCWSATHCKLDFGNRQYPREPRPAWPGVWNARCGLSVTPTLGIFPFQIRETCHWGAMGRR